MTRAEFHAVDAALSHRLRALTPFWEFEVEWECVNSIRIAFWDWWYDRARIAAKHAALWRPE
jgi:hypothetical protein